MRVYSEFEQPDGKQMPVPNTWPSLCTARLRDSLCCIVSGSTVGSHRTAPDVPPPVFSPEKWSLREKVKYLPFAFSSVAMRFTVAIVPLNMDRISPTVKFWLMTSLSICTRECVSVRERESVCVCGGGLRVENVRDGMTEKEVNGEQGRVQGRVASSRIERCNQTMLMVAQHKMNTLI